MTQEEIIELYINAAEVDRRLPDTARPARLKAQALPYVHDVADQNGWGEERYVEERQSFYEARSTDLQREDISNLDMALALIKHVERDRDRRCLWAWAYSKAGALIIASERVEWLSPPKDKNGKPIGEPQKVVVPSVKKISFSRWCRDVEGIHRNYGMECKNRAIHQISEYFVRNASLDVMNAEICTLQETPEISDLSVNIEEPRTWSWMAPGAFPKSADPELRDFSWAEKRNELRRQREARKNKAA